MNDPDAADFLKNLISLLKPGGRLQWFEPLPLSVTAVHPSSGCGDLAVDRYATLSHEPKPTSTYEWVERLPEAYREHGLEVIAIDRIPILKQYHHIWSQSLLAGLEDTAADVKMLDVEHVEALKKWIEQLNEAFKNGSYIGNPFTCVVGRKAR